MLHYILQTIVFQLFFLIIYDVFFKKETFFNWNRVYLLVTALLSMVLPLIEIEIFKEVIPQQFIIQLPEVILGNLTQPKSNFILENGIEQTAAFIFTWQHFFILGATIAFLFFTYKLIKIAVLIYKNPKHWKGDLRIVKLINSNAAFSFFHYVFLGERITTKDKDAILRHEAIHVKQNHTVDLLLFEILRILFWFNPLIYIYQNRMRTLHEFIADAKAVKFQDKSQYYQNLLAQVFETKNLSFINTFFKQSLIKKRIVMLTKSRSKQILKFKYALLIPLVFGMLLYTSSNAQEKAVNNKEVNQKLTNEQLKDKLYKELIQLEESGADFFAIAKAFMPNSENYIRTREEYYRFRMYIKRLGEKTYTRKKESGELNDKDNEAINNLLLKERKTYKEYLEWIKTDEAKERWENNTRNGHLKLVVNQLGSFTDEEQEKYDNKMKQLLNDEFYTKFIVTDGKGSISMKNEDASKTEKETTIEEVEVPFTIIDEVPIYAGCENISTNTERRKCLTEKINKHVQQNFNTDLAGDLGLKGRQRISIIFKIDKNGEIKGIRSRAPHPRLEEEAKRVISLIPKMQPGKQNGEAVIVPYSLPIIFQVKGKYSISNTQIILTTNQENKEEIDKLKNLAVDVAIPFHVIDEAPIFPECKSMIVEEERKKCTTNSINKFVLRNFNTNLAKNLGLKGGQRISAIFKIDKEGNITDIKSRAAKPRLEEEAKRVIGLLPKMIPGKHKDKKVVVSYSLPIIFQVRE